MRPVTISFEETKLDEIGSVEGRIAVFVPAEGNLDQGARRLNRLTVGASASHASGLS